MRIGYPCINRTLKASPKSFRLANYSENRLREVVGWNLDTVERVLRWNAEKGFLFFRISSDIVPFASHQICKLDWKREFFHRFEKIGFFIKKNGMRISMHPDQFVLINALDERIFERSVAELSYHFSVLDLMKLDRSAKIQIHVGGVYGDKNKAIERFVERFCRLPREMQKRIVIENDDRLFSVSDCLRISKKTGIPVVFDYFHHLCLNCGESVREAVEACAATWKKEDGVIMIDYSSQKPGARLGVHAESIDIEDFRNFLKLIKGKNCDIMLEIKDKEKSARKALNLIY